jgi:hypothetical protein
LGMPKKYTDFKQINKVSDNDIKWLNTHFNKNVAGKAEMAKAVFNSVKR